MIGLFLENKHVLCGTHIQVENSVMVNNFHSLIAVNIYTKMILFMNFKIKRKVKLNS